MPKNVHRNLNGTLERAVVLAQRGRINSPSENAIVRQVAEALTARGEPFSRDEERVLESAERLHVYVPAREAEPDPLEWIQRKAAAAATLGAKQAIADHELGELALVQRQAMMGDAGSPAELARRIAHQQHAEEAYRIARQDADAAGRVLTHLNLERAERRRTEAEARHATPRSEPKRASNAARVRLSVG